MKKLCILSLSFVSIFYLSNAAFSQATFAIKGSIDLMGESELDVPDLDPGDVDTGFGIGGEVTLPINEQVIVGGGIVYQFSRGIDEEAPWDEFSFNYVPIYALIQYQFKGQGVTPFIGANLGYNLLFAEGPDEIGDIETGGGIYWGIGGGVVFENKFFIEALYTTNNGTAKFENDPSDDTYDHTYTKFSIFVGKRF